MRKTKSITHPDFNRSGRRSSLVLTDESRRHPIRAMIRPAASGKTLSELRSFGGYFDRIVAKAESVHPQFVFVLSFAAAAIFILQK